MTIEAPQTYCVGLSEVCNFAVSFAGKLDSGELLTGTPTSEETSALSGVVTNLKVNTEALTILGETVAIGLAVQGSVSGWSKAGTYKLRVTCGTTSVPAQTRVGVVSFPVVDDGSGS